MSKELIVLHEYGEKRHFRALEYLLKKRYPQVRLYYREYSLSGFFKRIIKEKSFRSLKKVPKNLYTFFWLFFSKNKVVILGMAPYDFRMLDLCGILKHHQVFYFTSWANWQGTHFPKPRLGGIRLVQNTWKRFLEEEVAGLFAITQTALNSLRQKYRISCPATVVMHSFEEKIFHTDNQQLYSEAGKSKLNCLYVGRLVKEKGIDDILTLSERLPKDNFDFWFIGEGNLKPHIIEKTRHCKNVHWQSFIDDPAKLAGIYRESDVLLLPSRKTPRWEETFGMVIIEAMACGTVVIASSLAGPREILQNSGTGFLLNETVFCRDASIILKDLFENHSELIERKKKSIQLAQNYTAKKLSEKWDDILGRHLR